MASAERHPGPAGSSAPSRIGRYIVYEELARGGMAQVFVARKEGARDICVLKQLLVELKGHETAAKRFYREAHVASYLAHPNICKITDAGFEGDTFCIAMEFIPGKDVEAMMRTLVMRGRLIPYQVTFAVILKVLEALSYAHDHTDPAGEKLDLVHRDLSPRNMMLSFHGDVKVIDFGLVRGKVDDFKTQAGMLLGTPRYLSPEQAVASPVDRRSDLYTVGAVVHEMLTGRLLVPDGERIEVLKAVVGQPAPPVTSLNPGLPKALDAVILKALAKKKEERWQTAQEFHAALLAAAGNLADVKREALGAFLRDLYPEDVKKAAELQERGRSDFTRSRSVRSIDGEQEPQEWTNTGFARREDLEEIEEAGSKTRTGYVSPTDLGPGDHDDATRTAGAASGKTSFKTKIIDRDAPPDADQFTRTAMPDEQPMTRVTEHAAPPRSRAPRPASMPAGPFTSIPPAMPAQSFSGAGPTDAPVVVQGGVSRSTIMVAGALVFLAFVLGVLGTIFIMSRGTEVDTHPTADTTNPNTAQPPPSAAPSPPPAPVAEAEAQPAVEAAEPTAVPSPAPAPPPAPAAVAAAGARTKSPPPAPRKEKPEAAPEPAAPPITAPPPRPTARAEKLLAGLSKDAPDPKQIQTVVALLRAAAEMLPEGKDKNAALGAIGAGERDNDLDELWGALRLLKSTTPQ